MKTSNVRMILFIIIRTMYVCVKKDTAQQCSADEYGTLHNITQHQNIRTAS